MDLLVILVAVAGLSAAGVWWWMSRPETGGDPAREGRPVGSGDRPERRNGDFFVLHPSDEPPTREDRPAPALSLARLALAIAISTAVLVGVASAIGLLVKLQLDRYFTPGG